LRLNARIAVARAKTARLLSLVAIIGAPTLNSFLNAEGPPTPRQ
jgi:hypothetical protein